MVYVITGQWQHSGSGHCAKVIRHISWLQFGMQHSQTNDSD